MKILPTSRYIKEQVDSAGKAILLLGVRRSESATRGGTVGCTFRSTRPLRSIRLTVCVTLLRLWASDAASAAIRSRPPHR